jgi:hypothetical protein
MVNAVPMARTAPATSAPKRAQKPRTKDGTVVLSTRVPVALADDLARYAETHGVSRGTAYRVLMQAALGDPALLAISREVISTFNGLEAALLRSFAEEFRSRVPELLRDLLTREGWDSEFVEEALEPLLSDLGERRFAASAFPSRSHHEVKRKTG